MRRIFPKGTRINSSNVDVLKFWRNGSHVVSLNWQSYDEGMQINEAMFVGGPGWAVKPEKLGQEGDGRVRLTGEIYGISSRKCSLYILLWRA